MSDFISHQPTLVSTMRRWFVNILLLIPSNGSLSWGFGGKINNYRSVVTTTTSPLSKATQHQLPPSSSFSLMLWKRRDSNCDERWNWNDRRCNRQKALWMSATQSEANKVVVDANDHMEHPSDNDINGNNNSESARSILVNSMDACGFPNRQQSELLEILSCAELLELPWPMWEALFGEFVHRPPEVLSQQFQHDFAFSPLQAHQMRAVLLHALRKRKNANTDTTIIKQQRGDNDGQNRNIQEEQHLDPVEQHIDTEIALPPTTTKTATQLLSLAKEEAGGGDEPPPVAEPKKQPAYRKVIVNESAKRRKQQHKRRQNFDAAADGANDDNSGDNDSAPASQHEYGLPVHYEDLYPTLYQEVQEFERFMTIPSTLSQETPLRPATARVYLRHAKQFLGWYVATTTANAADTGCTSTEKQRQKQNKRLSLHKHIIPNKEKISADLILQFVVFLRTERNISVSYEANILRGLTKLLKYRFRHDSGTEAGYAGSSKTTFDDIPMIREVRKWHREAHRREKVAPRSSSEDKKWISWPEYLQVVQSLRQELTDLLHAYENDEEGCDSTTDGPRRPAPDSDGLYTAMELKIATVFQRFLVLAIFANVPDRQRTIRELQLDKTLVRSDNNSNSYKGLSSAAAAIVPDDTVTDDSPPVWSIRHAPDDYKTGKTYGERPPLSLGPDMTPWLDDFVCHWRPCLLSQANTNGKPLPSNENSKDSSSEEKSKPAPLHDYLFCQVRTGNPLTSDSVYQIVSRACYEATGKRTNPHLLRDMIVTHIRESSTASEQQLEALALFMGHSLAVQRSSYDRRTLNKKVAPAVELLGSINAQLEMKSYQTRTNDTN